MFSLFQWLSGKFYLLFDFIFTLWGVIMPLASTEPFFFYLHAEKAVPLNSDGSFEAVQGGKPFIFNTEY